MLPSSTVLSLAGAGTVLTVIFSGELGHLKAKCSPRPRKVFSRWCIKELYLQQHSINGFKSKKQNSLSSFAFGKKAEDSFFSDVNEDTDDMYEDLINNYGKVVFSRKDKKPASAEIDDDAESLSFAMELASVASEVKAADIKVLFVKPLVYWTRFFIIATAFSRPQIDAIGSRMRDRAEKKYGKIPTGDTKPNSWTLLDFGDVVVHIFLPSQRTFYNLEEFYGNATPVELPFENQPPFRS
ncbi:protein Iojap, chloroplastic-like [Vigna unguiculata]|uniref:Protein Iojap, chloroplastic n=2 Tax=Vigna unguiculata TaxID=3917 RepID=A0A4D6MDD1_VIGUN|nr:protein Iojap, chloroplastic-like [Vigna unguiculata]XP_027912823.1 protein Iojap, chloroplastic-like [Vigna unguiculata]XP_027912824.1 protein Iojap, chloroplastic-like [Vigna unguiculata]XP_027912825.1 protein Iojap, chloroplastic-like [Vigna unguiculata]XP_027912826.1 protein Iojap, chloroplastic-like [Vigna unguiculata]XP_027912827.1 protein Iojap, chloroplastic-like [Vigna unguiculata]XP_027912828.1 protein Iojap, chloroplastic-like [Vigna unguiculata]XP_027912829.1 protein Iojap, ch